MIVSSLTFHGGTNVIGYSWGSFNRVNRGQYTSYISREAPDFIAVESVGWALKNATGTSITKP